MASCDWCLVYWHKHQQGYDSRHVATTGQWGQGNHNIITYILRKVFNTLQWIMNANASQITGVSIVYSNVCSGADQRKHQSSTSLAFVVGIHRWSVNSPHKGPVTRKNFPFDDVIMRHYTMRCWSNISYWVNAWALPMDSNDGKPIWVQVMAWCHQAITWINVVQYLATVTWTYWPTIFCGVWRQ